MGQTFRERPEVKPKKAFKFQTFAIVRNYDGKVFVAKILSNSRLTGKGTKFGALKRALKFQKEGEKIEYFPLKKSWADAQKLEVNELKKLVKNEKPAGFTYPGAVALWQLRKKRGQDAVTPAHAPIGESRALITRKTVPKRRRKRI
jgi:hypothetical protein